MIALRAYRVGWRARIARIRLDRLVEFFDLPTTGVLRLNANAISRQVISHQIKHPPLTISVRSGGPV